MPWCPICKNEYVEGRTHCPDCDIDLVEELPMEVIEESNSYVPDEEELQELETAREKAKTKQMAEQSKAGNGVIGDFMQIAKVGQVNSAN